MEEIVAKKKSLRKELLDRRNSLDIGEKNKLDIIIIRKFLMCLEYDDADTLLIYYPIRNEIALLPIAEDAIKKGKKVAFPISNKETCTLSFRYVESLDQLVEGAYSILEPAEDASEFINDKNSVCVVPALGFDRDGYRIGYGKGYYDRFLKDFTGITIGLCYDSLVVESVPREKTDMPVDILITEKEEIFINAK